MKFAASVVLVLFAISAAQGNSWEEKAQNLEVRFEKVVTGKAETLIDRIKNTVHYVQGHSKEYVNDIEREINATVAQAIKEIEVLKLDVDLECFANATKDMYAAQQEAITNLLQCQNLSTAYQDVKEIAQNASTVILDVVKDAKLIVEGAIECSLHVGFAKWKCVIEYIALEVKQLIRQWPDAKAFIAVVQTLGNDVELQINACLSDPKQEWIDDKIKFAMAEFARCTDKSASRYASYVV